MKIEQIKVAQNIQKLNIHVTSLKLSEFEDYAYFECVFLLAMRCFLLIIPSKKMLSYNS